MDFKFKVKLDNKLHKAAVHYPTSAALTLAVKNIFYRHYKTDCISLPYIDDKAVESFKENGYLELVGVVIDGELQDSIKLEQ